MTLMFSRVSLARWRRLIVLVTLSFLGLTTAASAASFSVDDAADAPLASSAGTACVSTEGGTCTLRAAVQAADNAGGSSTISVPAGDYKLTVENPEASSEDEPATGDLDVNEGVVLTIAGAGASATTIDANHIDRAFAVHANGALSISGVTVENGSQNDEEPSDESSGSSHGGAFYNDGSLSIEGGVLSGNSAYDGGGLVYAGADATATAIVDSTVTRNTSGDGAGGVLDVESGSVTLSGDTITNNSAYSEGGVLYDDEGGNEVGAVTVTRSTLDHNVGEQGGALYLEEAGTLSVSNSALDGDLGDYGGGAVYDEESGAIEVSGSSMSHDSPGYDAGGAIYAREDGRLTVSSSTFAGDSTADDDGGALYLDSTDLSVASSTFENDQGDNGGAIYVDGSSAAAPQSIATSTFSGDSASDEDGGAIDDATGDLEVSRSAFTGDNAAYYGGALYYESGDGLSLTNDTFDGNQSGYEGGALYLSTPASTGSIGLLNDTIARNTAYYGGGIAYPYDANSIENTIVADNSGGYEATYGGGDCYYGADYNGATADKGGNLDSDGSCFGESKATGDVTGVDPLLGSLASNGGPTETDALLAGSPAIGKAIGAACPTTDQRGIARSAGSCDAGAYQSAPADLGVTIAAPSSTTQGDAIAYTLTVTNGGPGSTGGVTLTDSLPAGTSLYSVVSSQGTCAGTSTLTCALGALEDGASATVQVTAIANATGAQTDTASIGGTATDPNPANNSASATTNVAAFPASGTTTPPTPSAKPQASTGKASEKTKKSVAVSGIVNPEGSATTWRLEIGTSKKKLKRMTKAQSAGSGTTPLGVLAILKGLKPGTRYYVEIVAVNANGTVSGKIVKFKTKGKAPKKKHGKKKHKK
jgi:uncharacterized repeat protein (TIGR01451 family)